MRAEGEGLRVEETLAEEPSEPASSDGARKRARPRIIALRIEGLGFRVQG